MSWGRKRLGVFGEGVTRVEVVNDDVAKIGWSQIVSNDEVPWCLTRKAM